MKKQRYTLHDVAQYAGVSYQTVSRVVNQHPSVAPETRQRVQQVIAELGYQPNLVAKSLAGSHSHTLAVLTFGMNHYGPTQTVLNIERTAKELGYDLIFSNISQPTHEHIRTAMDNLMSRQVDGVLSIAPVIGMAYHEMIRFSHGIPLVQLDPDVGQNVPSVVVDQKYGSRCITEYLLSLGHRRIAEIRGPHHWFGATARHQQWEATLREASIEPMMSVEGDWSARSGYEGTHTLLRESPGFTALVVGNDQMALGAISALHERGLLVPEDVSVVGFDDIPEAAYFHPPLTTIRQDFSALGEVGVRYLLDLIGMPDTPVRQMVLSPTLIVRQSAAPPSA